MYRSRKFIFSFLVIVITMSFTIPGDWIPFTAHGFTASFPKKPDADSQVVASPLGQLRFTTFMYDASEDSTDENLIYTVITTKYPDSLAKEAQQQALIRGLFDGAVKGAVNNVKGKLLSQKDISFEGYPGREMKIDFQDGLAIIRMRIYMVNTWMYTLQTITYTGKDENKSIYRFMDSFKLLKK